MSEEFLADEPVDGSEQDTDATDVEYSDVESDNGSSTELPEASVDDFVRPVDDPEAVVNMYDGFEELKTRLLNKSDTTPINKKLHINKSGWRKIATLFNLSVETFEDERSVRDGVVFWRVKARAAAPNGRTSVGSGMCASNESNHMERLSNYDDKTPEDDDTLMVDGEWRVLKDPRALNEHNIYATAETRAKNRAISDLVGGGEVSAEEINADHFL